jgi:hypothetical protein
LRTLDCATLTTALVASLAFSAVRLPTSEEPLTRIWRACEPASMPSALNPRMSLFWTLSGALLRARMLSAKMEDPRPLLFSSLLRTTSPAESSVRRLGSGWQPSV